MFDLIRSAAGSVVKLAYSGAQVYTAPMTTKGALFASKTFQAVALDAAALAVGSLPGMCIDVYRKHREGRANEAKNLTKSMGGRIVFSTTFHAGIGILANKLLAGSFYNNTVLPNITKHSLSLAQQENIPVMRELPRMLTSHTGVRARHILRDLCQPVSMGGVDHLTPKVGRFAAIALAKVARDLAWKMA